MMTGYSASKSASSRTAFIGLGALKRDGSRKKAVAIFAAAAMLASLAGCASIPSSGPTAHEVVKEVASDQNTMGMQLVGIDPTTIDQISRRNAFADAQVATLASLAIDAPRDIVGPGDELQIAVFEVGVTLFSAGHTPSDAFDPSAKGQQFPLIVVDREGMIRLPYAGEMFVAGRTPAEIQAMITAAYRGKSQSPQALVSVGKNLSQTVIVAGDVRKPGRIELSLQDERLLDAIAIAGGAVTQTQDMVVRFSRADRHIEERLDRIRAGAPDDLVLKARDRIELIHEPQTFVVLGASGRVSQIAFGQTGLTLSEAVARAGGPNDATANPKAVFLFRYDPAASNAEAPLPKIYQLDLMRPESYFLAQRFAMRDKDVLYISNAAINRTSKFVGIINSLFSPFVAARTVSGN
jgi:polysaccharide export outer membrane protein